MSNFTTVDIPLSTVVLSSQSLPTSLRTIVSNQGILETYLETLYNTFEINSTNKAIGEHTPVNSINSKKYILYGTDGNGDPDTSNGIYVMQNLENTTNQGYFRPYDNNGSFGTEIKADKLTISKSVVFEVSTSITFPDNLSITNIVASGNVSYGGSFTHSIEYVTLAVEYTAQANNTITINGNTSRIVVIDIEFNVDIYDDTDTIAWQIASDVGITLVNDGMEEGQEVDIMVRSIADDSSSAITAN